MPKPLRFPHYLLRQVLAPRIAELSPDASSFPLSRSGKGWREAPGEGKLLARYIDLSLPSFHPIIAK